MAKHKSAVNANWEIVRVKASEITPSDFLFMGTRQEAEEYVAKNKPAAESQGEPQVESKSETIAQIFNVSPDETRTTQETKHQPVKALKAWGAKNR